MLYIFKYTLHVVQINFGPLRVQLLLEGFMPVFLRKPIAPATFPSPLDPRMYSAKSDISTLYIYKDALHGVIQINSGPQGTVNTT